MAETDHKPPQPPSFGGWESDRDKLKHNLTWTKEQILDWLEEANAFSREPKGKKDVLPEHHPETE